MSTKINLLVQQSTQSSRTNGNRLQATCLLCRVLWPRMQQHRHLSVDNSAEAKTLVYSKTLR